MERLIQCSEGLKNKIVKGLRRGLASKVSVIQRGLIDRINTRLAINMLRHTICTMLRRGCAKMVKILAKKRSG